MRAAAGSRASLGRSMLLRPGEQLSGDCEISHKWVEAAVTLLRRLLALRGLEGLIDSGLHGFLDGKRLLLGRRLLIRGLLEARHAGLGAATDDHQKERDRYGGESIPVHKRPPFESFQTRSTNTMW